MKGPIIIHLRAMDGIIDKYVKEYYTVPKKDVDTSLPNTDMLKAMLDLRIRNRATYYSVQQIDAKKLMIKNADDKSKCLPKPLKVEAEIGSGYFGSVYKVAKKPIAVKIIDLLKINQYHGNNLIDALETEVNNARLAGDLGIGPKIYDINTCCAVDGVCYFVITMEYLEGMTLAKWKETNPKQKDLDKMKALTIKKIKELHAQSIIHNDAHDNNIYIVMKGKTPTDVRIIDYGLSEEASKKFTKAATLETDYVQRMFAKMFVADAYTDVTDYVTARILEEKEIVFIDK